MAEVMIHSNYAWTPSAGAVVHVAERSCSGRERRSWTDPIEVLWVPSGFCSLKEVTTPRLVQKHNCGLHFADFNTTDSLRHAGGHEVQPCSLWPFDLACFLVDEQRQCLESRLQEDYFLLTLKHIEEGLRSSGQRLALAANEGKAWKGTESPRAWDHESMSSCFPKAEGRWVWYHGVCQWWGSFSVFQSIFDPFPVFKKRHGATRIVFRCSAFQTLINLYG